MFRFVLASTLATAALTQDDHPHLAQAWQALSSGDGLPNTVGLESYIFEGGCEGKGQSDTCMRAHVFDYGADNCIKYEVDAGFHSVNSGTFYVKCDAVNCCRDYDGIPDVKKWDIGQGMKSNITQLEATDLDDLDGHQTGLDTWKEDISVLKAHVKYTYYISQNDNGDIISHAIDYSAPGAPPGRILYGNFTVQHDLDEFRKVFHVPSSCTGNVMTCPPDLVAKWGRKSMPAPVAV